MGRPPPRHREDRVSGRGTLGGRPGRVGGQLPVRGQLGGRSGGIAKTQVRGHLDTKDRSQALSHRLASRRGCHPNWLVKAVTRFSAGMFPVLSRLKRSFPLLNL